VVCAGLRVGLLAGQLAGLLWAIGGLLLAAHAAHAASGAPLRDEPAIDLAGPAEALPVVERMQVLRRPYDDVQDPGLLLRQTGWLPATVAHRNASWQPSTIWLTARFTNRGSQPLQRHLVLTPWRVQRVAMSWRPDDASAPWTTVAGGRDALARMARTESVEPRLTLTLAPGQTVRVLVRLQDLTVPTTQLTAWAPSAWQRAQTLDLIGQSGMLLLAGLIFGLLALSRERGLILLGTWFGVCVGFEQVFNGMLLVWLWPAVFAPLSVSLIAVFGALGTALFAWITQVLLRLPPREPLTAILLGHALLTVAVATLAFFTEDHARVRLAVSSLALIGLLWWPVVVWRQRARVPADRAGVRRALVLSWAVVVVYALIARGGPKTAGLQVLRELLRLDVLSIGCVIVVQLAARRRQRRLEHGRMHDLAYQDSLTLLPNRLAASQFLGAALQALDQGRHAGLGVLYLDLDGFKQINDTHGHAVGDRLLCAFADRLRELVMPGDLAARLAGDEFIVVLPAREAEAVRAIALHMDRALREPYTIDGVVLHAGGSIGLACAPAHGRDAETLMRHADTALYAAKRDGTRQVREYEPRMSLALAEQQALREALHEALRTEAFELHYQPQRRLSDGRVTGVEALLRWRRADATLIAPGRFLAVAEECGLLAEIGTWALRQACRQAVGWGDLTVCVNVSAPQLRSGRLLDEVRDALQRSGLPAQRLELDLTEASLAALSPESQAQLPQLRALGVRLAIDDFGAGHASLACLQRFAVDRLKIDHGCVAALEQGAGGQQAALLVSLLQVARRFGLQTVAERVESAAGCQRLIELGCDCVQGHAVAMPMPAARVASWLLQAPSGWATLQLGAGTAGRS
jgi:diguanylate cyclase (GGDEF)-like protein